MVRKVSHSEGAAPVAEGPPGPGGRVLQQLPPYSSKAVARARILFAIREGQGSFDLS